MVLNTVFDQETTYFVSLQGCGQLHSGHVDGSPRIAVIFIKQNTKVNNILFKIYRLHRVMLHKVALLSEIKRGSIQPQVS